MYIRRSGRPCDVVLCEGLSVPFIRRTAPLTLSRATSATAIQVTHREIGVKESFFFF